MSLIFNIKKMLGLAENNPDFGTYYIQQSRKGEDALACVAMLLNYHSRNAHYPAFRKKYKQYTNVRDLSKLAELCGTNGLYTKEFTGNYLELKTVAMPCIIRWRMDRYAVLLKVSHERYFIFDPGCKRYEYQQYEVECYYCESALIIQPMSEKSAA